MRTAPVSSMCTDRHNPPGFHVGSMVSLCYNEPVMLRLAVRWRSALHATSTAST